MTTRETRAKPKGPTDSGGPPADPDATRRRLTRRILWLLAAAVFVLSVLQLGIVPERLAEAVPRALFVGGRMWPPVIEDPAHLGVAVMESLQIAVVGTVFGILLSVPLALLAARNISPLGPLCVAVKALAGFVRAVPALVWALLFVMAVGLGPEAGVLAIGVNSIGMLVKVYAESLEEIPMGPVESLRATGASRTQIAFQAILPSVVRLFIAWSVFRFDINVRYSTILGVVGAGGIGWELARAASLSRYDIALGITVVIFLMVMGTELISQWLRRRVDGTRELSMGD